MKRLTKSHYLLLGLFSLLFACAAPGRPTEQQTPVAGLARSTTAPDRITLPPPTHTAAPTNPPPTPPPTNPPPTVPPIQSPVPTPSLTPIPVITVSVPESWRSQAAEAVEQLNNSASLLSWRLVEGDQADVHLVNDASGTIIRDTALALAVPFTMDWEDVSHDQAREILKNGHESVTILPWPEMMADQKALRIDGLGPADSGYPLRQTWSLVADAALNNKLEELVSLLQEPERAGVVHLVAVGDIMLDRTLGTVLRQGDLHYPFSEVVGQLQGADISVGNFESALGNTGVPEQKSYTFRAPPQAAASLALAGFDVVSLANNHGMDYGEEALLQAVSLLQEQDVIPIGAGENRSVAYAPRIVEVNGLKTAFFGYVNVPVEVSGFDVASWEAGEESPGIAWADPQVVAANVAEIRDQVDLIVIMLHSGYEYIPAPSEAQQEVAHAAIDAGANLIIGHHAHVLQGIEYYKDGVIIYGTGNFAFVIDGPPESAIFHVWLDRDGVREIAVKPAIVQPGGKPRLADSLESQAIRKMIYSLTGFLNTQ